LAISQGPVNSKDETMIKPIICFISCYIPSVEPLQAVQFSTKQDGAVSTPLTLEIEIYRVWISVGTSVILSFSGFYSAAAGKLCDTIPNNKRFLPSKQFPIHH
jgi:hypothetical protein